MATVDTADVRALLESDADASLVFVEGKVRVVPGGRTDEPNGALHVTSRRELIERVGHVPDSDEEVSRLAENLTVALDTLGG